MNTTRQTSEEVVSPSELTERRYVYNGDAQRPQYENIQRGNRPVRKRKRSPFNVVIILFAVSIVIVLYVWNKITVNRLVVEVNEYQTQYEKLLNSNESLRGDINKKTSLDRIQKIAVGQLGLIPPREQPVWFTFDDGRLSRIPE